MVAKRRTRSTKKVSSLKAKSLTPKQAKSVKGGIIVVCAEGPEENVLRKAGGTQALFQKV
jgi:hypothetical protein